MSLNTLLAPPLLLIPSGDNALYVLCDLNAPDISRESVLGSTDVSRTCHLHYLFRGCKVFLRDQILHCYTYRA